MRNFATAIVILAALPSAGCSKPVDLKQSLQITDVAGGYHDAGVVNGKNKLVPSITFRLKKPAGVDVTPLSLNVAFKQLPEAGAGPAVPPASSAETDWDEKFVQSVPFDGDQTKPLFEHLNTWDGIAPLTFMTEPGYTADPPQSRADILKHRLFRDVRVHIFAKHSASQWVEIGAFDIPRQLLTQ